MGIIIGILLIVTGILIKALPYFDTRYGATLYKRARGVNESYLVYEKTKIGVQPINHWLYWVLGVAFIMLGLMILVGYLFFPILTAICILTVILRLRAQKRK